MTSVPGNENLVPAIMQKESAPLPVDQAGGGAFSRDKREAENEKD